ncbi:MAG: 23S rRNA (pseudouridine(1915)-N(3))-methyltransferase RlmH [Nitrospirae bacterium]|nr:23S rRNA (pseudouridine(1915)-N(3))-methyltransferase RlmH [Nitrospirota bacterium]MCL5978260.1 23S rRNA (pseudouridine(1915)-N(3))-methyltransferase RlmH [Nitrospirota bacterium]
MKARILWVGRTKEKYLTEGINRYLKMLKHMANVSVIEVKEEKGKTKENALFAEGERILRQTGSYILLDESGREFNSKDFARFLGEKEQVDFVLGGAYGVSSEVKEKAAAKIALSKMTLTHEMARLIFLEQFYRAMTIIKGKEYHH